MMFTGLVRLVSRCLDLPAGWVIVHAGSAHIYEQDALKLPSTHEMRWEFTDSIPRTWGQIRVWAREELDVLQRGGTPNGIELVW
jgi:hypothetical protein